MTIQRLSTSIFLALGCFLRVVVSLWRCVARPAQRAALSTSVLLLSAGLWLSAELHGQQGPSRIISLVPAVTEMLFALGAGGRVVGVGSFDKYPPAVERLPRVGALLDPDLERILSLRPDLVAIYGSQADLRRQLERAGIPTFVYSHGGLAGISSAILDLGTRIGATGRARQLTGDIDRRLQAVKARMPPGPAPRTLVVMGRDNLALRGIYASGGYGFIH